MWYWSPGADGGDGLEPKWPGVCLQGVCKRLCLQFFYKDFIWSNDFILSKEFNDLPALWRRRPKPAQVVAQFADIRASDL